MLKIIDEFDFTLTKEDILRGQGIDPERASQRLQESAESVIEETHALIKPRALYDQLAVLSVEHKRINFDGGYFEGSLAVRAMAGADHLNIAVCTIGEALDLRVEELMNDNPVLALSLDGAGIAAITKVSHAVRDLICSDAYKKDLSLGMRAQPGQEGWPIEQQRKVFEVLPADRIGVTLTDSCLMLPRKSVSFIIPEGREMSDAKSPCDYCSKRGRCNWKKEQKVSS